MLVIEDKCPQCYGNLILDDETRTAQCEECGYSERARTKREWLEAKNFAVEFGPREKRHLYTLAGEKLVQSFKSSTSPDDCWEIFEAIQAHRGLISDEEKIKELQRFGFIL